MHTQAGVSRFKQTTLYFQNRDTEKQAEASSRQTENTLSAGETLNWGEGGVNYPVFSSASAAVLALFCLLTRPNYACHLHQKDGAKINKLKWVKALGAQ